MQPPKRTFETRCVLAIVLVQWCHCVLFPGRQLHLHLRQKTACECDDSLLCSHTISTISFCLQLPTIADAADPGRPLLHNDDAVATTGATMMGPATAIPEGVADKCSQQGADSSRQDVESHPAKAETDPAMGAAVVTSSTDRPTTNTNTVPSCNLFSHHQAEDQQILASVSFASCSSTDDDDCDEASVATMTASLVAQAPSGPWVGYDCGSDNHRCVGVDKASSLVEGVVRNSQRRLDFPPRKNNNNPKKKGSKVSEFAFAECLLRTMHLATDSCCCCCSHP